MKANELIKHLQGCVESHGDLEVTIMQEAVMEERFKVGRVVQFESNVKDIAATTYRFVIIGKELD